MGISPVQTAGGATSHVPIGRRSGRVSIRIPVQVVGIDIKGEDFVETAHTEGISRYGATLIMQHALAPDHFIFVQRAGQPEIMVRVVGQVGIREGQNLYGISLEDSTWDIWGISFPSTTLADESGARVLLECGICKRQEVCILSEVQLEVFAANNHLGRNCKKCLHSTEWWPVKHSPDGEVTHESAKPAKNERRKHTRVCMKLTACVRQPGHYEEVVTSADVSKGGMRFRSKVQYMESAWLEVAIPFTAGGANIFTPARVANIRRLDDGSFEYGVSYAPGC